MTRRRKLLIACLVLACLVLTAVLVFHARPVQERIWISVAQAIHDRTGIEIAADKPVFKVFPASVTLHQIVVSTEGRPLGTIEMFSVSWRWRSIFSAPRRLQKIVMEAPRIESFDLSGEHGSDTEAVDFDGLLGALEIGELRVLRGSAEQNVQAYEVVLAGLSLQASLEQREVAAVAEIVDLRVRKENRDLDLGPLHVRLHGGSDGVVIDELELDSGSVSLRGRGSASLSPPGEAAADLRLSADLQSMIGWWDPNLATGLEPEGVLELDGSIRLDSEGQLRAAFQHEGEPLRLVGYDIEEFGFGFKDGLPTFNVAHPSWGRATTVVLEDGSAEVSALLDRAPVDQLLAFVAPRLAAEINGPTRLSGNLDARVSLPLDVAKLSANADLRLSWADGSAVIRGEGSALDWNASKLELLFGGARLSAVGRIESGKALDAEFEFAAADVGALVETAGEWFPEIDEFGLGGGPLTARGTVTGSLEQPHFRFDAAWATPLVAGTQLSGCEFSANGGLETVQWQFGLDLVPGSKVSANGVAQPMAASVEGRWSLESTDAGILAALLSPETDVSITGVLTGEGDFSTGSEGTHLIGELAVEDSEIDGWYVPRFSLSFAADPTRIQVTQARLEILDGFVEGTAEVLLEGDSPLLAGEFHFSALHLAAAPLPVPDVADGRIDGVLRINGALEDPEIGLDLHYQAAGDEPLLHELRVDAGVLGGVLRLLSSEAVTAAGKVVAEAEIPLGAIDLPEGLWPNAPSGAIHAKLDGKDLQSGPLADVFAVENYGIEAVTDLVADLRWDPAAGSEPQLLVEANGLRLIHRAGEMVAEGPLVVRLDGHRLQVDPLVLLGPTSRIEVEAIYDPTTEWVEGRFLAQLAPVITEILPLPVPVQIDGQVAVSADFQAPAAVGRWSSEVRGKIQLDHRGGTISMRDPPLQIKDLVLDASIEGRVLTINDGRATVNRGTVELAGGWDPVVGQGLVADVHDVTVFTEGILTKWDGVIAVEPHPGRIANIAGDLNLLAGLWDESVALAGTFFGESAVDLPTDDPLHEISLDVTVRGRSGIRVDNNLGRFDAAWDVIRVGGTAAEPILEGEVRIAPGGTIAIAGNRMKVRRGSLDFTGDPTVDPIVEIVPETDGMTFNSDSEKGVDPALMATRGLATGLSSVLGFENETLQPADIAVQIERDPSVQFMIGQRLTRNLALFFGANLTDVQDRTTMIQAWNFRGLRGLIFQAYQETIDSNLGFNIMQQFRWGGSRGVDDQATIHRLRFEGDWPLSTRSLRKATRLRRGQPFDPFLLFVGAVRLERVLAENGYQQARVRVSQTGPEESPTMVFTVAPGTRRRLQFLGDVPSNAVQREANALYRPPPLENRAFANIESAVRRHFVSGGFLDARVTVSRDQEDLFVEVDRSTKSSFIGPLIDGVSPESSLAIRELLASRAALALAINDPDRVARSIERILAADGYLNARVERVWLDETESGGAVVRIEVTAGERQTIAEIMLVGSDPLGVLDGESFGLRSGLPLDRSLIDSETRAIRRAYLNAGYRESRIRNNLYEEDRGWVVLIDLDPGRQRTVDNITLAGAHGLSERVLRKGLLIEEGALLTDADLDGSASRIANFAPVERVEVRTSGQGSTAADVEFDVITRKRWRAEVGGGWSTERGAQGRFGLVDNNLFRRGVTLSLRGSFDSVDKRVFLVGSLPPAPGSRVSLISTLGYSVGDAPDEPDLLEQDEILASLEAQYALRRSTSLGVYYRWTNTHTYEKIPDDFFPFDIELNIGILGLRTVIDRYDNLFDPRAGYSLTSDVGWSSGSIGSDLEYVSWLTNFGFVFTPFKGASWLQTLRVGVSEPLKGTNLDREAKFFAGGQSSIRGFDLNSVGPVTFGIDGSLVPAGGGALFVLNEELRIPIYGNFRAAVFADIGQVWESWSDADLELSIGIGAGVRWSTPVGPLWADVAWPVSNVGISSKKMKFYLGIGRTF